MAIQLAKALIDLDFSATLADTQSLTICQNILNRALRIIEKSQGAEFTHYPVECPKNELPQHQRIVAIIYEKVIKRIAHPDLNFYPFNTLLQCLKHLNPSLLSKDDKITVINRLEEIVESKSPNARKNLQFDIA